MEEHIDLLDDLIDKIHSTSAKLLGTQSSCSASQCEKLRQYILSASNTALKADDFLQNLWARDRHAARLESAFTPDDAYKQRQQYDILVYQFLRKTRSIQLQAKLEKRSRVESDPSVPQRLVSYLKGGAISVCLLMI